MGEWEKGRVGEGESGRVGERANGGVGEWESGRMGECHCRPWCCPGSRLTFSHSPTPPLSQSPRPTFSLSYFANQMPAASV